MAITACAHGAGASFYYGVSSRFLYARSNIWSQFACTSRTSPCSTSGTCSCSCWRPRCASPPPAGRIRSTACGSSSSPTGTCSCCPSDTPAPRCPGSPRSCSWRSSPGNPPGRWAPCVGFLGTRAWWLLGCPRCSQPSPASCPSPVSLRSRASSSDSSQPLWSRPAASSRSGCCSSRTLRDTYRLFSLCFWPPAGKVREENVVIKLAQPFLSFFTCVNSCINVRYLLYRYYKNKT